MVKLDMNRDASHLMSAVPRKRNKLCHSRYFYYSKFCIVPFKLSRCRHDCCAAIGLWNRFARNPISGSSSWFFVIILKFILTAIFEIKNHVKNFPGTKKKSFSKLVFYKPIHIKVKFQSFTLFLRWRIYCMMLSNRNRSKWVPREKYWLFQIKGTDIIYVSRVVVIGWITA